MHPLRIMTFNVENMLERFDFKRFKKEHGNDASDFERHIDRDRQFRTYWKFLDDNSRDFTALAIRDARPDIVCLQEVESLRALRAFDDKYVRPICDLDFRHKLLIEGNDGRGINVGVMSRLAMDTAATHQASTCRDLDFDPPGKLQPDERIFRRDCLELRIEHEGRPLTLFICHFKSMSGTRRRTRPVRQAEAKAVRRIIERRFPDPANADWLIAGDLNDYTETDGEPDQEHGLGALIDGGFSVDLVKRIPDPMARWTHYYAGDRSYHQLDYLLASPALAARNKDAVPTVIRAGQPGRAERYTGKRFPKIGWKRPKASDHCPVVVELLL